MMTELSKRNDQDLAFLLRYENIAWYEEGEVRILDRRIYPIRIEFVSCKSYQEVAQAIADMVTQSEGPYTAAAMGMALAVHQWKGESQDFLKEMERAADCLSHARPTTSAQMERVVAGSLAVIQEAWEAGQGQAAMEEAALNYAYQYMNNKYERYTTIGRQLAEKIPDGGKILTQCFPGTVVGTTLREIKKMGKSVKVFCAETRPYLQGARLTASVAQDMGFDTTVICDNMPACTMQTQSIDLFTSAADVITLDGHVINKVGTFQIALAAHYLGLPFYVTGTPDPSHPNLSSIQIEERNPEEVTSFMGIRTSMEGVKGYYPAFDICPPDLVTGIVTEKGIYRPEEVRSYLTD